MADDPRIEAARPALESRLRMYLADRSDGPIGWGASVQEIVEVVLAAADQADPLRALLADEDRLIESATRARHAATKARTAGAELNWDDWPEWAKENWRKETRKFCGPVLAALREVAGL
jgi:hypothetical protein